MLIYLLKTREKSRVERRNTDTLISKRASYKESSNARLYFFIQLESCLYYYTYISVYVYCKSRASLINSVFKLCLCLIRILSQILF
jgi:hypothetical protein